jgi:hypothetical protein
VIAVFKTFMADEHPKIEPPAAPGRPQFGFDPFEPPASWLKQVRSLPRVGDRWRVHAGPGFAVDGVAERIVGGQPACESAIGMLVRIVPEHANVFAATKARYYVAQPGSAVASSSSDPGALGFATDHSIDTTRRKEVDRLLTELLKREHPKVRGESEAVFARVAPHANAEGLARAREWSVMEDALAAGSGVLKYDVQAIRLTREEPAVLFVRAQWLIGGKQAFAATVWIKGGDTPEIADANVKPASWLRMHEFRGRIAQVHLGLVLNVLDRDGDGQGEVLFAQGGYEGLGISLLEYSTSGMVPQGVEYSYGC